MHPGVGLVLPPGVSLVLPPGAGEPGDLDPVPAEELGAQEETGRQGHQEVRHAVTVCQL